MKWKVPIDLHKGLTPFVVVAMMAAFDCWTTTAWVYLALHGTYGVMWVLKSATFPDANWEREKPMWFIVLSFVLLLGYWVAPLVITANGVEAPPWLISLCVALVVLGTLLHFGSDAQKYYTLRAKKGLITDGFFRYTRNPNYLGEVMLYVGFALLSMHWAPWVVLVCIWAGVFWPNMRRKDRRMSRHDGWDAYVGRTGLLLPTFWR